MRLVQAEVLKLVRRRGLMIWCVLLTVGVVTIVETVLVILHAVNSAHHGPAGGASNFRDAADTVGLLGTLSAVLIGATGGSQDVANGVFRDLVVTGRKRSMLFKVRTPGAFLVWAPMVLVGFGVVTAASFASRGVSRTRRAPRSGMSSHTSSRSAWSISSWRSASPRSSARGS